VLLWRRTSAALLCVAVLGAAAPAGAAITIPSNTWVKQPTPTRVGLPGFSGTFQARGWNSLIFDPVGKRALLFDGYLDASRPYSIYANALWTYDALNNRLSLESVTNWVRQSGVTVPLPANTTNPTPYDRHPYSHTAFVPEKNSLYMWSGANSSLTTNYLGDTWVYDFGTHQWREIVNATHPFAVFEQAATYDPATHRFVLFGGAASGYRDGTDAWLFDVNSELWEKATTASVPGPRMGQTMVYDPMRRVSYMFGGGYPYPAAGNELWAYDASARTWQRILPSGTAPSARRFAAMAYDSRHDIVLLWGGRVDQSGVLYNDTWIYRPSTRTWQQLAPQASPPASDYSDAPLAYDPDNDVFILHQNGEFWLFRYASSSDALAPGDVRDLRIR